MARVPALAAALLLALAASGCGSLPRPFMHRGPVEDPLLALHDARVVVVDPPAGIPEAEGRRLAAAMAAALRDANVPANASAAASETGGYRLSGRVGTDEAGRGPRLVWRLTAADGRVAGTLLRPWEDPQGPGFPEVDAKRIAGFLQDPDRAVAPAVPPPARVAVLPVAGATGDGNRLLAEEMRRQLPRIGAEASDPASATLLVAGRVQVAPPRDGRQAVTVTWIVRRPDGTELARLRQGSTVDAGRVERTWRGLAADVATDGIEGLAAVLEALRGRPGGTGG